MFDVKTPLSKIHRATRRIPSTFLAVPGIWAAVGTNGSLYNIPTTCTAGGQPQVLKPVLGNASSSVYESNDIKVGSIATLETPFRASVDGAGYAKVRSDGTAYGAALAQGADLSVAFVVTNATGTSNLTYSLLADLGKLKPACTDEVVVARVESCDVVNGILTFETVTPHIKA